MDREDRINFIKTANANANRLKAVAYEIKDSYPRDETIQFLAVSYKRLHRKTEPYLRGLLCKWQDIDLRLVNMHL